MMHREVDGTGDEAHRVRVLVQAPGGICVALCRHGDSWPERDLRQLAGSIGVCLHPALGIVLICRDHDATVRTEVQVPQHVTGGERGHQHVLRVVPVGVSQVAKVGRALEYRPSGAGNVVVSSIGVVGGRALPLVSGPGHSRRVGMPHRFRHGFRPPRPTRPER